MWGRGGESNTVAGCVTNIYDDCERKMRHVTVKGCSVVPRTGECHGHSYTVHEKRSTVEVFVSDWYPPHTTQNFFAYPFFWTHQKTSTDGDLVDYRPPHQKPSPPSSKLQPSPPSNCNYNLQYPVAVPCEYQPSEQPSINHSNKERPTLNKPLLSLLSLHLLGVFHTLLACYTNSRGARVLCLFEYKSC